MNMMGWIIKNNHLIYVDQGNEIIVDAKKIFSLTQGKKSDKEYPSPAEDMNLKFSKIGARIEIQTDFNEEIQNIEMHLIARAGKKHEYVFLENGFYADQIVMEGTWYNLIENHRTVLGILNQCLITGNGSISLVQYIELKKALSSHDDISFCDNAEEKLRNHPYNNRIVANPVSLNANLYPYQLKGFKWLKFIVDQGSGCVLGDEMGLGKTLQIIALTADIKQSGAGPSLVIAPVSLLENWRREFEKFTKGINVLIHHGSGRTGLYTDFLEYDVVISSYNIAITDLSLFKMINWELLVLDEAQFIKNPAALRTKSVKKIPRRISIAVSGTPFENHITDVWSIMDFIMPGSLGTLSAFQNEFTDDLDGASMIEPILTPLMLRRRVLDVADDLPRRVDIPQLLEMTPFEMKKYDDLRQSIISKYGDKKATLPVLQKLRMFCTHPKIVEKQDTGNPAECSRKYERLCELLEEIVEIGGKTILFTSYNEMFSILETDIPYRFHIPVYVINGATPVEQRQSIIDDFSQNVGAALLVLNPRAAGVGLNITAANRVIHYNPEWNPALEDQASARAFRRGQERTVFIYRFYYKDTVEEIIKERLEKKREMFEAAIVGIDGTEENRKDIMRALMISPGGKRNEQKI